MQQPLIICSKNTMKLLFRKFTKSKNIFFGLYIVTYYVYFCSILFYRYANEGKKKDDNLALSFIHGFESSLNERWAPTRVRWGKSGNLQRDFIVYVSSYIYICKVILKTKSISS